jgi:integrase
MRRVKLLYLRTRKYTNRAGETWVGYYYEPPRVNGKKPPPIALGSEMLPRGQTAPTMIPPEVIAEYSRVTGKTVRPNAGSVESVYMKWLEWARKEVAAGRLARRTLEDYEDHWALLKPVFGAGHINGLDQSVLWGYYDKRSSKDRAKREVAFLGVMCGWARPRKLMQAPNPVDRDMRKQMRVRSIQAPTVKADAYWVLWQCGDQLVRDTLSLAYMLATRPAEAIRVPMPEPGAECVEKIMPKTSKRGRKSVKFPMTAPMRELIERRRALCPHSLYILFDEKGQQLKPTGTIRSRLLKAREAAKLVCEKAEIPWQDFTLQQLRPTAITKADKEHGREGARKLAGHTTEKQTADYIRHEAEEASAVQLPAMDAGLAERIKPIISALAVEKSFRHSIKNDSSKPALLLEARPGVEPS